MAIDTGFEPVFRGRQPRALTSELIDRWRSGVPLRKNAALQAVASTINAEKLDQFAAAVYAALAPTGTMMEAMLSYCIVVAAMEGGIEPSIVIVTLLVDEPH